jgi:hypothetical protein
MTPRQFLEQVVQVNVAEFHRDEADMRLAYNAVASVDSLAAHIYVWCSANAIADVDGSPDDTMYRDKLWSLNDDFQLLRDIAKAQKHVKLNRGKPIITEAKQIGVRPVVWGEGPYGHGAFGGPPQVVVDINLGNMRYVVQIVDGALRFLEAEMERLGIQI